LGALMATRRVVVLGSTGSVGVSTLDLLARIDEPVDMLALTAGRNAACLADQALRWRPRVAVIQDESRLPELRERLNGSGIAVAAGTSAII
jgi:1-deoxy-D-xylulose-5-phosphate reductoisomerase